MRRSRYQRSVCIMYHFDPGLFVPSIGEKPKRLRTLPTTQNPVSATVTEAAPVAMISSAHSGWTNAASDVAAMRTIPAISQTVRSMYHRFVGTM